MVLILELFSGTCSIGKVAKIYGWDVVSVDLDNKFKPTHNEDILTFNYQQYPPGHFSLVWASPPCTKYSIASRVPFAKRDLIVADQTVKKTLEIIKYFQPTYWYMENPQTGYLKSRDLWRVYLLWMSITVNMNTLFVRELESGQIM